MSDVARLPRRSADGQDDLSLPGWVYHDPDYFRVEMARLIRPSWQIVCHANDIIDAGDWRTLEILGDSVIVIRGGDGLVRAFSNVCRHRGSRLVDGTGGCAKELTGRYHAGDHPRGGGLVGVPHRHEYPGLKTEDLGLKPVTLEQWQGFLLVTLEPGAPSVAEMMAPYAD